MTTQKKGGNKFLFLKKKFDGIHDRQHCKKLIHFSSLKWQDKKNLKLYLLFSHGDP
jgi:hypothetical protein